VGRTHDLFRRLLVAGEAGLRDLLPGFERAFEEVLVIYRLGPARNGIPRGVNDPDLGFGLCLCEIRFETVLIYVY